MRTVPPTPPSNRADWNLTDWHAHDPAGLATMHAADPRLFAQLYQQHYGTAYQPANRLAARNAAPASTDAPAPTEPARRSLLAQLPTLGPLLTAMLDTAGKMLTALPGNAVKADAQTLLRYERVLAEGLGAAAAMVSGTQAAVYLTVGLGVLDMLADEQTNPVRRTVARLGGVEAPMWANYRTLVQNVVTVIQKAEKAAADPTAADYEVQPAPKGREQWTLQDWLDKDPDGLRELRQQNPNLYSKLFREKYGINPEL